MQPSQAINPFNEPLAAFRFPDRSSAVAEFWERFGVEPVMLRVSSGAGLTLCTPTLHESDTETLFLASDERLHVAHTAEGLIELMRDMPDHDLASLRQWPELAESVTIEHIAVAGDNRFDLPAAVINLAEAMDRWLPIQLKATYDFSYDLAISLGLDDVLEALSPDSALYEIYTSLDGLGTAAPLRWTAKRRMAKFDSVSVFDAWSDIETILSDHVEWHR
jgi:hypothetical protein